MSNQNSTTSTSPVLSSKARDILYKFNLRIADDYAVRAMRHDLDGQPALAQLALLSRDKHLGYAAEYAPEPEWCPIARRAFILCGPNHVANERYCKRYVKRIKLGEAAKAAPQRQPLSEYVRDVQNRRKAEEKFVRSIGGQKAVDSLYVQDGAK